MKNYSVKFTRKETKIKNNEKVNFLKLELLKNIIKSKITFISFCW